ncbi:MAG: AmmeMemoRadiSam system protein B [Acidobacteria bacterium]|nr:AmmeMemoRadiSam system protein B [Acidobacteriota bacterium]
MATVRPPVVAGKFYPLHDTELRAEVTRLFDAVGDVRREPARGVLVPHAGYVYSGRCAAETLARVDIPSRVILLGPNHTGRGSAFSLAPHDLWRTPIGNARVDHAFLMALEARCPRAKREPDAHRFEHALEVEVPWLQVRNDALRIAPITVGTHVLSALLEVGAALAETILESAEPSLVLVSSDMTHYESASIAREKDAAALERICALDAPGLQEVVTSRGITMCGVAPAVVALAALSRLGARSGDVVCYTHSGEVTGDDREVVAYAGVVIH